MKCVMITILIASLTIMVLVSPTRAEMATIDEGLTVANNWITLIIQKKGDWGGSETAEVEEIQEFKRGARTIGYLCRVKPRGFIVISLHKELAPVKAYSATSDLPPESGEDLADVIKIGMERVLETIERHIGPLGSVKTEDMEDILETNYSKAWKELEISVQSSKLGIKSSEEGVTYQGGRILVSSRWNQKPPFNNDCPWLNCTNSNGRAKVGCVATAGAQIMRYWNWPPFGEGNDDDVTYYDTYDWVNMPDYFLWSQTEIDAVAELCFEMGWAAHLNYGCDGSGTSSISNIKSAYKDHFYYSSSCRIEKRKSYADPVEWFELMKAQFNSNRPVQYLIYRHSMVGDGWQEIYIDGALTRQYHMNYGGSVGFKWWYTLDELDYPPGGDLNDEFMLIDIYPAQAMGWIFLGTYEPQSFRYRYFDRDAVSWVATFKPGHLIQFLPGIKVTCISSTGLSIRFQGSPFFFGFFHTLLFTRGDQSKGIRIHNGTLKLNQNGSLKFF
jgi:hypothetical protein